MAFLSSPGSTNEVDTANIQVNTVSTPVSTVSSHNNTANLSDATVYAFLANQPNGFQLVHEDVEQIHEDDLEKIDLKWQLALLSMRARRYFQRTSKKITINWSDTADYVKTKVECFNYHKMGHFARECKSLRNQKSKPRNQDNLRKTVNVEDTSSKATVAIDGACFYWSYMADDEVLTNMAFMAFLDSEIQNSKTCSNTCLASVEEQLVFYKKNEVMFCDQIDVFKRDALFRDSEINALNLQIEKLKKEKEILTKSGIVPISTARQSSTRAESPVSAARVIHVFYEEKCIKREYNVARTPQQNRVAERRNKTLIEAARTMLADSKLPTTFWAEAVNTACYVRNRVLVVKPYFKTLYELFKGKFDGKSNEGIFAGYSTVSKAFRVYNIRTRKVEENMHITFLENKPITAGGGPEWLFDIDALSKSMNYAPVPAGTTSNDFAGKGASFDTVNTATPTYVDYPNDPLMPDLKDAGIFDDAYDDRDKGAESDYNNLETVISVSPIPFTRIHKNHLKEQIIREVNSAVQTRKMAKQNETWLITFINKQRRTNHKDFQNCLFACFLSQMEPKKTKIHEDNESAICMVKNLVYHSKTKHIEISHHFIRDSNEKRLIEMVKIHTDYNVAELVTKAFDVTRMECKSGQVMKIGLKIKEYMINDGYANLVQHADKKELAIPGQMNTGKEFSNPLMVEKSDDNTEFHQIVDFFSSCSINYALTGMDISGSPKRQNTMGGTSAQTRSERVLAQPNEPPLIEGHTSRSYIPKSDEGSLKLNELMDLCTTLSNMVSALENELSSTKTVYHKAFITLTKRVKKLETQLKQKRSRAIIHSSDEEEPREVQETAKPSKDDDDATLVETLLNIRKTQKLYAEELAKETTRQKHEKYNLEKALELQRQLDKREKDLEKGDQAKEIDWNDPTMLRYHALQN
uniref:Retroviral polymerase SH3-like domain-containing protein n=1 Tax=Tanacetum cinerariifolium TaxID=118510 RepID=A0A6L2MJX0_TANCI|nr:hypothetical protein [Tanacetum cinerariifolium]